VVSVMQTALLFLVGLAQTLLLLLLAPLLSGMSRVMRAKFHSRRGPPILQDYYDLGKLLARAEVIPAEAGLVFRATPYVLLVAMLLVAMAIPALMTRSPVSATGDLIASSISLLWAASSLPSAASIRVACSQGSAPAAKLHSRFSTSRS